MSPINPLCSGAGPCNQVNPEVRLLPCSSNPDHGNLILCSCCYSREIAWRRERNRELAADCQFDLPAWLSLKVYGADEHKPEAGRCKQCGQPYTVCPQCGCKWCEKYWRLCPRCNSHDAWNIIPGNEHGEPLQGLAGSVLRAYLVRVREVVGTRGRVATYKIAVYAASQYDAQMIALRLSMADPAKCEFEFALIAPGNGIVVSRG